MPNMQDFLILINFFKPDFMKYSRQYILEFILKIDKNGQIIVQKWVFFLHFLMVNQFILHV